MMLDKEQAKMSAHIRTIAQLIYDTELQREDSLIQQSARMQTAFSFMSATLFMVATLAVEHRYPLSYGFLLLAFSSIAGLLIASLVVATIAQRRVRRKNFCSIEETKEFITKEWKTISTDAAKDLQYIDVLSDIQADLKRTNDNKVVLIKCSMGLFYGSIGASIIWFVVALIKMKGQIS